MLQQVVAEGKEAACAIGQTTMSTKEMYGFFLSTKEMYVRFCQLKKFTYFFLNCMWTRTILFDANELRDGVMRTCTSQKTLFDVFFEDLFTVAANNFSLNAGV